MKKRITSKKLVTLLDQNNLIIRGTIIHTLDGREYEYDVERAIIENNQIIDTEEIGYDEWCNIANNWGYNSQAFDNPMKKIIRWSDEVDDNRRYGRGGALVGKVEMEFLPSIKNKNI